MFVSYGVVGPLVFRLTSSLHIAFRFFLSMAVSFVAMLVSFVLIVRLFCGR